MSSPPPTPAPGSTSAPPAKRPGRPGRRLADRVRELRSRARQTPAGRIAWRIGVTIVGVLVVLVGIVLLPLPGPGWLIIFAGLGVLSTEYAWAARLLHWVRKMVGQWVAWAARQGRAVRVLLAAACFVVIAAIIVAAWFAYRIA
jgi:uncharacterized protein (TIGR02611 family)